MSESECTPYPVGILKLEPGLDPFYACLKAAASKKSYTSRKNDVPKEPELSYTAFLLNIAKASSKPSENALEVKTQTEMKESEKIMEKEVETSEVMYTLEEWPHEVAMEIEVETSPDFFD